MGRVSRYKKVKSIDPFAKNGSWKSDVGDCATIRRSKSKRRSKTALKLKEQKMNKLRRRLRGKEKSAAEVRGGGCNGWGDDDGYDLPPTGGDDFDLKDLVGSVKKERSEVNPLMEVLATDHATVASSGRSSSSRNGADNSVKEMRKAACRNAVDKNEGAGALTITAKTPTREIIAACSSSSPKSKEEKNNGAISESGLSKKEKRKAFLEKKKSKKRKRGSSVRDYYGQEGEVTNQQSLQSIHLQPSSKQQIGPKKHMVKLQNYSDTILARTVMNDQAERPPVFTSLPRGAGKLAKNQKTGRCDNNQGGSGEEAEVARAQRIQKEQRALEAMRERVVRQYAVLRERRRNGSG